jgi:hypothetical protein
MIAMTCEVMTITIHFMKKSFSYSAASLWNSLPTAAKEKGIGLNKFKCILDGT